jgi:hypothetical protein
MVEAPAAYIEGARERIAAAFELARQNTRHVCILVDDAGVKRVRVLGSFPVWDALGQRGAMDHARSLRAMGFRVWIDRQVAPATSIEDHEGRSIDYKPRFSATAPPMPVALEPIDYSYMPPKFAPDDPPLRVVAPGIHTAGVPTNDGHQFCTNCGGLLATFTVGMPSVPCTRYPVGASIQRGAAGWQAGMIGTVAPTCAREAANAS